MAASMEEDATPAAPAAPKRSFPISISLGSCIGGVPIKLHLSFFLLLLIEFITSIRLARDFPLYMLFVVVLYGPVLLLTVLIHELGHIFATKRLGGEVGGIVLWVSKSFISYIFMCHFAEIIIYLAHTFTTICFPKPYHTTAPWWIRSMRTNWNPLRRTKGSTRWSINTHSANVLLVDDLSPRQV
jgi:hypothetical protein